MPAHTVTAQVTDPSTAWLILLDAESGLPISELRMEGAIDGIVTAEVELDPPVAVHAIACNLEGFCSEPSNAIAVSEPSLAVGIIVSLLAVAVTERFTTSRSAVRAEN